MMKGGLAMVNSKLYLNELLKLKDHFSIKVITGIRGVGKTTLLSMFADYLKNEGVPSENIIYMNFDEIDEITEYKQLYESVNEKIVNLDQSYLLFDEIQNIEGWEKTVNAFFVGSPVDIYITGSNDSILSENFLNLLSDHYELIQMQPLSFNEYLNLSSDGKSKNTESIFQNYLKFGGLPITTQIQSNIEILPILLSGLYHTTLTKDIITRYGVRDAGLLNSINKFLAKNIGKPVNFKRIEDYLSSVGRITTMYTVDHYLRMIDESGIFCRVKRYDIKTRTTVNGSERFYCGT